MKTSDQDSMEEGDSVCQWEETHESSRQKEQPSKNDLFLNVVSQGKHRDEVKSREALEVYGVERIAQLNRHLLCVQTHSSPKHLEHFSSREGRYKNGITQMEESILTRNPFYKDDPQ